MKLNLLLIFIDGLKGVGMEPNPDYAATIPHMAFMIYQAMFAVITPALISGAIAERMKFSAFLIFMLLWTTVIYDPVAHWVWRTGGWMKNLGVLDFAGGIGVLAVGHTPAQVVEALKAQAEKLIHMCAIVGTYEPYVQVAELLNQVTPGTHAKKSVLLNSGAEAVETAIKIARSYTKRPAVIVFEGAYHGRTNLTPAPPGRRPRRGFPGPPPRSPHLH